MMTVAPAALSPRTSVVCVSPCRILSSGSCLMPSGTLPDLSPEEQAARDKLISYIVAQDIWKGTVYNASVWYSRYLQSRFIEHWHALVKALVGLDDETEVPRPNDLIVVFDFVLRVAEVLKTRKSCALTDIVDALDNDDVLKDQLDEERAIPNQIVFAAVGWLSMRLHFFYVSNIADCYTAMLYEAHPRPASDQLQITTTSSSSSNSSNAHMSRKYRQDRQGFDHIDRPLSDMLSHFGQLIPGPRMKSIYMRENPVREVIKVQSVCFATLRQLANLRIVWVSSLALHFEFDSGKKTLKLFQFPSFCRMMTVEKKRNLLSRLLNDHAEGSCEDASNSDIATDEFFEEMLITYRLLFGQDEKSWRAFARMANAWEAEQSSDKPGSFDPLLRTLCAQSCLSDTAAIIYKEIDAGVIASQYEPHTQFPFFGARLLELQEFVKQHQPQSVRGLFSDKRDVEKWWTLWSNLVRRIHTPWYSTPVSKLKTSIFSLTPFFLFSHLAPHLLRNIHDILDDRVAHLPDLASHLGKGAIATRLCSN